MEVKVEIEPAGVDAVSEDAYTYVLKNANMTEEQNLELIRNLKQYIFTHFNINLSDLNIFFDTFDYFVVDPFLRPGFRTMMERLSDSESAKTIYTEIPYIGFEPLFWTHIKENFTQTYIQLQTFKGPETTQLWNKIFKSLNLIDYPLLNTQDITHTWSHLVQNHPEYLEYICEIFKNV